MVDYLTSDALKTPKSAPLASCTMVVWIRPSATSWWPRTNNSNKIAAVDLKEGKLSAVVDVGKILTQAVAPTLFTQVRPCLVDRPFG